LLAELWLSRDLRRAWTNLPFKIVILNRNAFLRGGKQYLL